MLRRICFIVALLLLTTSNSIDAAPSVEHLLPGTTKAYFSVPNVADLQARFEKTQVYQLMEDPAVKPFAEDLKKQLRERFDQANVRLGINLEKAHLFNATSASTAIIRPNDKEQPHAMAVIANVTGEIANAEEFLKQVGTELEERNATKSMTAIAGQQVITYTVPNENNPDESHKVFYVIFQDHLLAADHQRVLADIIGRFDGQAKDTLAEVDAYKAAMARCAKASGESQPQIRWFVEPFGYARTIQDAAGVKPQGKDFHELLMNQGFGAIKGLGGWVMVSENDHEFTHHTWLHAPADDAGVLAAIKRQKELAAEGIDPDERIAAKGSDIYANAARMLNFPNQGEIAPQSWIPKDISSYTSMSWKIGDAFEYAKSLVNEMLDAEPGEDLFEEILDGIANDVNGPQLDIRAEFVAHLKQRMTVLAGHIEPINPNSKQWIAAIEVDDHAAVAKAVEKFMNAEPNKQVHKHGEIVIWEIINIEEEVEVDTITVDFGADGFEDFGAEDFGAPEDEEEGAEETPLITQWAITVTPNNHVLIGSTADYIKSQLDLKDAGTLSESEDYQRMDAALAAMGSGNNSIRLFSRLDKTYKPTYELIRQGKLAQSDSLLGKLTSRLLGSNNDGGAIEKVDTTKMPEYEVVAKYLGVSGAFVVSEPSGWFLSGCLLTK